MVKPCCFVTHIPNRNFGLPEPQNGPGSHKNLENGAFGFFFGRDDRAADGRKHSAKMRVIEISKKTLVFDVFSLGEKQILETRSIKQHAFLVNPLRAFYVFRMLTHWCFLTSSQKGEPKPRKGLEIWLPHRNFEHPDLPKGPIPTEKGAKRAAIPSFERRKGPRACLEEVSLTGILGQIRIKHATKLWEMTIKILSLKI